MARKRPIGTDEGALQPDLERESHDTSSSPVQRPGQSRREFLRRVATAGAGMAIGSLALGKPDSAEAYTLGPPLPPAPGGPLPWHAGTAIYKGVMNHATGNAQLSHRITSWPGVGGGLSFGLFFNSQSSRTGVLGPKWTHSYNWYIVTGSGNATLVAGDGSETLYTWNGSAYVPPIGIYDQLVHNGDGSWTRTATGGTKYIFNTSGKLTSIVDLNSNTLSISYAGGLATSITDAVGRVLSLGYTNGLLTTVTDPTSSVWTLTYDSSGRVSAIVEPVLNSTSYSTQFGYDANNNVNAATDRLGKTWSYTYGSSSVLSGVSDPNGYGCSAPYIPPSGGNPTGTVQVASWTDANGHQTQHSFDQTGRRLAHTDALGHQTTFGFDASNNQTSRTLPSGDAWQYGYDGAGNQTSETDPNLKQTTRMFNSNSQITSITDPNNNTTGFGYDSCGNLTSWTDPLNKTTSHTYNPQGLRLTTTDPQNRLTSLRYDALGNCTSVTDPLNHVTQSSYDTLGRLTQRTDALNRVTSFSHDAWGRLTGSSYPTSGNPAIAISYDAEGRITSTSDGTGSRTYSYNVWGKRTAMTDPRGNTSAVYDNGNRMIQQTDVSGRAVSYGYDTADRVTSVGDSSGSTSYSYTANGQISTVNYPNGTRVIYGYDHAGRPNAITHQVTLTSALIVSYATVYDGAGRVTQVTEQPSGDVTAYGYDSAGRVASENRTGLSAYSGTYTYDYSGLRTSACTVTNGITQQNATYGYDGAGRLIQVNDTTGNYTGTYTWNSDATLATFPGPGYTRELAYNEEGQLLSITRNQSGVRTLAYEYGYGWDGGRRWRKDHLQNVWTWFPCGVGCGAGGLIEEQSDLTGGTWTVTAQYLSGQAIVRRNGEFHHWDNRGTAGVVSDGNGNVLSNNLYDAFRVPRYTSGTAQTPWRWQSAQVAEEGLQHIGTGNFTEQGTSVRTVASKAGSHGWSECQECIAAAWLLLKLPPAVSATGYCEGACNGSIPPGPSPFPDPCRLTPHDPFCNPPDWPPIKPPTITGFPLPIPGHPGLTGIFGSPPNWGIGIVGGGTFGGGGHYGGGGFINTGGQITVTGGIGFSF